MWKSFLLILCVFSATAANAQTKVLSFAGSSRNDSVNKKLAIEAARIAGELGAEVKFIDLKDYPIPIYNEDFEAANGMPENARSVQRQMAESQVILIASPEYNSSLPALLKNTLDWASRSETNGATREAFKGKKFVIMSAVPGNGLKVKGLDHLRTIIEAIGGTVLPYQIIVPNAYDAFDDKGMLKDQKLSIHLKQVVEESIK